LKVFSNYAQYYDLLNQGKDYKKEVKYILTLFEKYASNPINILDMGCGTGCHAMFFAENGYQVYGVDKSPEMIAIANSRLNNSTNINGQLKFSIGDATNYESNKIFDAIISLFHVMSYQTTNHDINRVISTANKHLKDDGLFIFDCWYGPAVLSDKPYVRTKKFENDELVIKRKAIPKLQASRNTVDVRYNITITNKKTGQTSKFSELHRMRYLFEPEMEILLTKNGFEIIRTEEWLTREKPDFNTWYITFICKKR
jgi:SAM-dependent methyltransferase